MKALVVDGYNAIYKIPRLKRLLDQSLAQARKGITEMARNYKRRCGGIGKICVVFDGKDEFRNRLDVAKSADEVFSMTGCGDKEIIRVVGDLSSEYDVIVASDDNFVRNNSRAQRATLITVDEFAAMGEKKKPVKKEAPRRKINIDAASEIDKELREHYKL